MTEASARTTSAKSADFVESASWRNAGCVTLNHRAWIAGDSDLTVACTTLIVDRWHGRNPCCDRATTTCNLLDFNGTDSPFLIL